MKYHNLYLDIQDLGDGLHITLDCPIIKAHDNKNIAPPMSKKCICSFVDGVVRIAQKPKIDDHDWLKDKGKLIYKELFSGDWRNLWQQALAKCREQGFGLRITLYTQGELAEETPWELLYDPVSEQFFSCTPDCVIVRSPSCGGERIDTMSISELPVRVLAMSASPPRYSSVHPDIELKAIQQRLRLLPTHVVDFSEKSRVTWEEFVEVLQIKKPHMVHLVAHGDEEGIFFEDDKKINYGTLVRQLVAIQNLRVLILSGCNSKYLLQYKDLLNDKSRLPALQSIWALVVTGTVISSVASLTFVKFLYTALVANYSLTYAVGSAKNALAGNNSLESLQWSIPMLHDTCDVIIFPPIKELWKLAGTSPLQVENMLELQQKIDELASKLSEFHKLVNDNSELSCDFFELMNNQPKQIQPEVVLEVEEKLESIHDYPSHLTMWMNSTRNIASTTYQLLEQCATNIDELAESRKNCIPSRKLTAIRNLSARASKQVNLLKKQFEELLCIS